MNKYQEALITVSKSCKSLAMEFSFSKICDTDKKALNILKELVDKETPKKVIKETIYDAYDCNDRSIGFEYEIKNCPNCNLDLVNETEDRDFEDWDYCPNCGQKLDWSDENDEK